MTTIACLIYTLGPPAAAGLWALQALVRRLSQNHGSVRPVGNGRSWASSSTAPSLADETGSRDQTGIVSGRPDLRIQLRRAWPPEPWPERIPGPLTPIERRDTTTDPAGPDRSKRYPAPREPRA
jgi:hypothetical protein